MIKSADWLCETHFGKNLIDKGVEILDPATGTGTFIVELLEHFRGNHEKLRHKYKEELHANEVAILPYYVANLNIEATYAAITEQFAEYPNLCFVDTLDNVAALGIYSGHQGDMFGSVSDENMARVKRQNERKISVIIGNPPYNANQQNENDNNKNRSYARIDERIKQTYIKASTAQKTKLYDMYSRFFRWASDRLTEDGVLAFITNRSFIESRTFDGFRKMVAQDFNEIWVVDLGGDVRANPKLSGTKHNVFGIQTGVAICYLVRKKGVEGCTIRYVRRPEDETAEDKLSWLGSGEIKLIDFTSIKPDRQYSWINLAENDFDDLLPIHAKAGGLNGVFDLYSMGIVTARDEWVYDEDRNSLASKAEFLISTFNHQREGLKSIKKGDKIDYDVSIKWSESLKRNLITTKSNMSFESSRIIEACYRPFNNVNFYNDVVFSDRLTNLHFQIFGDNLSTMNSSISLMGDSSGKPFFSLAINRPPDLNFVSPASGGTRCLPRYRYSKSGERVDNITDWAVAQFVGFYASKSSPSLTGGGGSREAADGGADAIGGGLAGQYATASAEHAPASPARPSTTPSARSPSPSKLGEDLITKDAIFAYCYAVLHDPLYREKYALNLKREFPRIPFYPDFAKWVEWGEALLKLHIDYEKVKPAKLTRVDTPAPKRAEGTHPRPKLKSNPELGQIQIDEDTQLTGVPVQAWDYRLGNRSAIDWVLDQHKEKTPRDPTIREKFNTYRFADYKESCIELLGRVVTVSVETVAITEAMKAAKRE